MRVGPSFCASRYRGGEWRGSIRSCCGAVHCSLLRCRSSLGVTSSAGGAQQHARPQARAFSRAAARLARALVAPRSRWCARLRRRRLGRADALRQADGSPLHRPRRSARPHGRRSRNGLAPRRGAARAGRAARRRLPDRRRARPGLGARVRPRRRRQRSSPYRFLFPGYTLVAYDDRGTGDSGLLDCPALQRAIDRRHRAGRCRRPARRRSGRSATSTAPADHAEDLEAVRQALGFDKVALFGVSYGTKLAMAYALAHPDHVERMLLDSVLPPEPPDPYQANVLRACRRRSTAFCSDGGCRAATSNFAGDVVAAREQARGETAQRQGRRSRTGDEDGHDRRRRPALDHRRRRPEPGPRSRAAGRRQGRARRQHAAAAPPRRPAERQRLETVDRAQLRRCTRRPSATTARSRGRRTRRRGRAQRSSRPRSRPCRRAASGRSGRGRRGSATPTSASTGRARPAAPRSAPGRFPNVPVLAVSGGFDMRTPTAGAPSVVARFPQGKLLVVPGIGHSTRRPPTSPAAPRVRCTRG